MNRDNLITLISDFIKYWNFHYNENDILEEALKHPDYPSLLSISDILNTFSIKNNAFFIEDYNHLNCPFIAHINSPTTDFLLIKEKTLDKVLVSGNKWNNSWISKTEFSEIFGGVVLTADDASPPTKNYNFPRFMIPGQFGLLFILLALSGITAIVFHSSFIYQMRWPHMCVLFSISSGLIISILLLIQSIDDNNPLIAKICNMTSESNCNSVLSSNASYLFNGLKWSDIGFFYFSGTWLLMLFGSNMNTDMQVLAVLNIISLPYTVYSIFYQAKTRQWCILCCAIQGILWLEFFSLIINFHYKALVPTATDLSDIFIAFVVPACLWLLANPVLQKSNQVYSLKQQLRHFKYNTEIFSNLLLSQPEITLPGPDYSIVLGDQSTNHVITLATNPYCSPCANTHKIIDDLLHQRSDLQVRIVFAIPNTEADEATLISRHLMALSETADAGLLKKALHEWYSQANKEYSSFIERYPIPLSFEFRTNKLNQQQDWCRTAHITGTPTIFINTHKLPDYYSLTDVKYMLDVV